MFNFEIVINNWILIRLFFSKRGIRFVLFNYEINPVFEWKYYTKYRVVR